MTSAKKKPWLLRLERMLLLTSSPEKRKFDLLVSVLVVVSTAMLFSKAYQTDDGALAVWLHRFDTAVLLFFLAEYLARLGLVKVDMPKVVEISAWKKLTLRMKTRAAWMLTPLAMVDLLSILPLFMPSDDLVFFRILRLLRLLRLYRIFIYHDPLEKLGKAFTNNSLLYWVACSMVGSTILLGAIAFYVAEAKSNSGVKGPFDAVWWTVVTLTTVGYGDTVPSTLMGRVVAMVLMLSGVILFAIFTGVMSQTLVGYLLDVRKERIRMSSIVNHIVICGWSRRGSMIAAELRHLLPDEEIVIFADQEEPVDLPDGVTFLRGDACKEAELGKVRLGMARSVVVLAPGGDSLPVSDGYTALVVYTVRSFERKLAAQGIKRTVPLHICAELMDPENFDHLKVAGADEVVHTALVGSNLLAHSAVKPGMAPVVAELLSWWGQGLDVDSVPPDFGADLPFREVANMMQERFGFMVVGVMTVDDRLSLNPPGERKVRANDRLVLIRKQEVIDEDSY